MSTTQAHSEPELNQERDVVVSTRVPVSLRDELAARAQQNDRSLAAEVRRAIRSYVDTAERAA